MFAKKAVPSITMNNIIEGSDDTIAAHTQLGSAINVHIGMENGKIVSIQGEGNVLSQPPVSKDVIRAFLKPK